MYHSELHTIWQPTATWRAALDYSNSWYEYLWYNPTIINQVKPVVKCQTCSIRVNKNKCPKQYYARVIVRNNDAKLNFTLFQQSLTEILDIYNKQNSEALDIAQISEEELEEVILSFDTFQFTYDFTNSRITKIEAYIKTMTTKLNIKNIVKLQYLVLQVLYTDSFLPYHC